MIACCNPRFILSPSIAELLGKYHTYYMDGKKFYYPFKYRAFYYLDKREFNKYLPLVNRSNVSKFFVLDSDSGESFNIFIEVPCGHCVLCQERKVNDYVQRCKLECESYDSLPLFATLTYDQYHKPADGVCVRDVQLFLKRLRINLFRSGYFRRLRYIVCSHYGPTTFRPHYHIILWNFTPTGYSSARELLSLLQDSWSLGEVRRPRWIDSVDDKCFYYTCRYMFKHSTVPSGCNNTFVNFSRGNGSLGVPFLKKLIPSFRLHPHVNFKFKSKWTSSPVPLRFNRFILDRLLPSFCTSVPSLFRTALRRFAANFQVLQYFHPDLSFLYEDMYYKIKKYGNYLFFGFFSHGDLPSHLFVDDASLFQNLTRDGCTLARFSQKFSESYFKESRELDRKRRVFLGDPRNFRELSETEFSYRVYSALRRLSRTTYSAVL